ncbi:TIGR02117 family protein [Mucilaginibacter limnophilus]|uniref:TIGR02117 family protein n=1 Tax=Mucilaginibacter limnophilus TaxID=1932778 RepID=A0A437MZN1_9SPHI|nr:TIGR02117 family protein [Mucilaginibacter limnophilus]RVU03109.1 TIGR02117 family protein [Mucilaginibacter limnophilus]
MKQFISIVRILSRIVLWFIIIVVVYLLAALLLSVIPLKAEPETGNDIDIFMLTNGVHTDIAVPIRDRQINWADEIKFDYTAGKDTNARYVALGWGDRAFYLETPTWADLKFSIAFKAAFGLGRSAIHATFYKQLRESKNSVRIKLNNKQYHRLIDYINKSFVRDKEGHIINIENKNPAVDFDAFFEANGRYSIFYTCNTWVNQALKRCGQKACIWTPFDKGLFYQYGK